MLVPQRGHLTSAMSALPFCLDARLDYSDSVDFLVLPGISSKSGLRSEATGCTSLLPFVV